MPNRLRHRNSITPIRLGLNRLESRDVPSTAFALATNNVLFRFDTETPGAIEATAYIHGLQSGELIRGIDFRPATGQLIGLGVRDVPGDVPGPDEGRIYSIDSVTGQATQIGSGPFSTDLAPNVRYGVDFNPAADRLRIVNSANQNLRVNPNTGALVSFDNDLNFVPPANGPVVAIAYDQNFAGTPTTTLFGIDFQTFTPGDTYVDSLVRIGGINGSPSPNGGQVTDVGPTGLILESSNVGFDIRVNVATGASEGFATVRILNDVTDLVQTALFRINLQTGEAFDGLVIGNGATEFSALAIVPDTIIATGADAGGGPHVEVFNAPVDTSNDGRPTDPPRLSFFAYAANFTGGVRVATGDVNRDGVPDIITSPGFGGGPHVRVFDGKTGEPLPGTIGSFMAYDLSFTGGVFVASADFDGDGYDDVVTGADSGGGPHVKVFSGFNGDEIRSFFAYNPVFTGGVRVAAGDLNGDLVPDIVTGAGPGGGPHVKAFSFTNLDEIASFMAYTIQFRGGVTVAVGKVTGDGTTSIITGSGQLGTPLVRGFVITDSPAVEQVFSFQAYNENFRGGIRVSVGTGNGDGHQTILVSGGSGPQQQEVLTIRLDLLATGQFQAIIENSFLAYDPEFVGGVFVAGGY